MAAALVLFRRYRSLYNHYCNLTNIHISSQRIIPNLCALKNSEIPSNLSWCQVRSYAKGKDRKKDKQKNVVINEAVLSQAVDIDNLNEQYEKVLLKMKQDYVKNFTLRSSIGALDTLPVNFEGTEYTLQDVAQIGKKAGNTYVVDLSSFPQVIPDVLKSIQNSGLGLNPQQDGTTLFIPIPKITKDFRETMAKNAKAVFIKTRDNLRDVQNKFIKSSRNKVQSDDVFFSAKEQITLLADKRIEEAEKIMKMKQDELLL